MPIPPRILTNELGCKCLVVGRTAAFPPFVEGVGDKQRPKASRHYVINVEFLSQRTSRGKTPRGVDSNGNHRVQCGHFNGSNRRWRDAEQTNSLLVAGYYNLFSDVAQG